MSNDKLTIKQQKVLDFLKKEIREKNYPPSIREICDAVGLSSTSTVHLHLSSLEKKGYIRRSPAKNRAIEVVQGFDSQKEIVNIPILGQVAAGSPILAEENYEDVFPLAADYLSANDVFMLRIAGDSMVNAGILNHDLVMVKKQDYAYDGEIVVALIEDSATAKTYYHEGDHIRLQPENDAYEPILVKNPQILGKVIGLFRFF